MFRTGEGLEPQDSGEPTNDPEQKPGNDDPASRSTYRLPAPAPFVEDMKAFFAEENRYKQDEIALRQLHALKEHQGPREKALRLSEVSRVVHGSRAVRPFQKTRRRHPGKISGLPGLPRRCL